MTTTSRDEARVDARDEDDFRGFVVARSPYLLRTAYLLTGDRGHAEDLLQTALLNTYRHWRKVRSRDQPDAFVRQVMVNQCASWWRRPRIRELATSLLPEQGSGRDEMAAVSTGDEVRRALMTLPVRTRTVLVLRYWDDLTEKEIAAVMGCSTGSVKSQASRGIARLRAELATGRDKGPGHQGKTGHQGETGGRGITEHRGVAADRGTAASRIRVEARP